MDLLFKEQRSAVGMDPGPLVHFDAPPPDNQMFMGSILET